MHSKARLFALIALLATPTAAAEPVSGTEALELAGSVHVIFDQKCSECHGSQLKEPKGEFGYVLDLQRVANNRDYLVRGQPEKSDLYRLVKDGEMPPDDNPKARPLTAEEKEIVRRWILAGAPSDIPAVLPTLGSAPVQSEKRATSPSRGSVHDRAKLTTLSLEARDRPAGEVFAEIAKQSGIKVEYVAPANEPRLSIALQNGTVLEALEYLALCGNFSLRFKINRAIIGPNPPPPTSVPAVPVK